MTEAVLPLRWPLVLAAIALVGCGSVPVHDVFSDAAELAAERTGERIEWADVSADAEAIDEEVREILARPLSADATVRVALLHNRRLQARYSELARAAAAKVQAGLPPNPFLEVVARFRSGDQGKPQLEISVVEEILELFLLPARKRLATVELERARLDLAADVVDLVAATRGAFVRHQAERQLLELDLHALLAVEAAWEMAVELRRAGNISELDLLVERDFYEGVKLEVSRRELAVAATRERLNELMGLWGSAAATWTAEERLPELPADGGLPDEPEQQAVAQSLDLARGVLDLEAAARRLGIADVTAVFPELEAGAEAEREIEEGPEGSETEWWAGPSIGFRLPLFDQGRPRRVGAAFELRGRWDELAALGVDVRATARRTVSQLLYAEAEARHARDVLLPLRTAVTRESQLHYNGMFLGVFQLLEAKRRELDAGRSYVSALRDYWLARSALDQLLAGRMPDSGAMPATGPESPGMNRGEGAEEAH